MKKNYLFIALAALLLPALLRGLSFYRGFAERPGFATPDFAALKAPQAPANPPAINPEDITQYGGVVLFDASHGNQFTMTEVASLTEAITQRGGRVELHNDPALLEFKLKYASAFVAISPSITFTADEIRLIKKFTERGGRLLVFTDATRNSIYFDLTSGNPIALGDVNAANPLLAPFGISINNDYLYSLEKNEGNFRNVIFDDFAKNELTFGLKEVALYGTHSLESPSGLILLRETESTLSSANDANDPAQGGAALSRDGNVTAFGDITFMSSPYNNYADNASLIANLADFALSGTQKITLDKFPFVFNGSKAQVYLTSEIRKTAEIVSALGKLQASLQFMNIAIEYVNELPRDGDAIIISSYTPGEELTPLINKFDLTLENGSEFVEAPGFGKIGIYGNTFLLLDATSKGNTLTLLANSLEDAIYLLDSLKSGYLSGCMLQEKIAVCSAGSSSSSYSETGAASGETTPQPEPTATPGG
ncbi:MAG: hypothetical protein HZB18_09535 [Chloroflexi bacterium]|nr:hypothetical protein [Chloroflexota bacterium]